MKQYEMQNAIMNALRTQPDVHDLRIISRELAQLHGQLVQPPSYSSLGVTLDRDAHVTPEWKTRFYRAVCALRDSGAIESSRYGSWHFTTIRDPAFTIQMPTCVNVAFPWPALTTRGECVQTVAGRRIKRG
jgi:hypothetical protein